MKKILLILLLGAAQSSLAAQYFNGFYVKGGLGATGVQFEDTHEITFETAGSVIQVDQSLDRTFNAISFAGMLGVGYSYQVNALWVISAEFTAQFTNVSDSNLLEFNLETSEPILLTSTTELTLKNDFALLLKPGLITLEKTQFYALVGPRWGNFETSADASVTYGSIFAGSGSASDSGYVVGLTVGIGVERLIEDGFSVGLEYSYTSYGKIPSPNMVFNTNQALGNTPVVVDDQSIQSSANTLMFDVSYRF